MNPLSFSSNKSFRVFLTLACSFAIGCTGQLPNSFRYSQQLQNFAAYQSANTKVDMLWVIDNSGSMESAQSRVRAGITQFAQQYLKPTWDIHLATITVDSYLADPSFWAGPANQTSYLTTVRGGTGNYSMPYLNGASKSYSGTVVPARSKHYYDSTSWVTDLTFSLFNQFEPSTYAPPTVTYNSAGTEKFQSQGMRIIDAKPQVGPDWAKLLIGNHDGPQLSMCWDNDESSPQFIYGVTACYHHDDPADPYYHVGYANCANPAAGEAGTSQCVNTFANNSVHTGMPILSTQPPAGTPGDQTWINNLVAQFQVNLTPSTVGNGSERAFQSVLEFLKDNESDPSLRLFRPDSLRIIVFVGDEDDQSQSADVNQYQYGANVAPGSGTPGHYVAGEGTKAHMIPENASAPFICKQNYSGANSGYFYPQGDTGFCVDPAWLIPVADVKQDFDNFFLQLDGLTSSGKPNYFVAAITTMNTAGISQQGYSYIAQRYPALVNLVGNGSLTLDLTQSDYAPLLAQIGQVILTAKAVFTLQYPATDQADMIVSIVHQGGSSTVLTNSQYTISGTTLTITDLAVVSNLSSTDQLAVNYQPSSLN